LTTNWVTRLVVFDQQNLHLGFLEGRSRRALGTTVAGGFHPGCVRGAFSRRRALEPQTQLIQIQIPPRGVVNKRSRAWLNTKPPTMV